MRQCIWIMIFLGISAYAATEKNTREFVATLPDGTTVELVGLRYYNIRNLEQFKERDWPWWRPDGSSLDKPPDEGRDRGAGGPSHLFAIRVRGNPACSIKAVGPQDRYLDVQAVAQKARDFEKDDLRRFALRFSPDQKQANIKLCLAVGQWTVVDRWSLPARATPYNMSLGSSDQIILRCPEQVGLDVVAEVTQILSERATRLVLFDRDGKQYESEGEIGGEGVGLVQHIHRFKEFDKNNIEHIEFQARSYECWITFHNVSLEMGQETQVQVEIRKPGYLLAGEALPNFDGIKIDLPAQDSKSRMLLVCFFDMNQRPSRNCILQLARQAEQLKEKGVTVVTILASNVDENTLNEWVKKNKISFPIGTIQDDREKIRFNWGVKSLPWLILADSKQIVRAEGFSLGELEEKVREN